MAREQQQQERKCPTCNGNRYVGVPSEASDYDANGLVRNRTKKCETCNGTGKV